MRGQLVVKQRRDEAVVAEGAVVGGDLRVGEELGPLGVLTVTEAEQRSAAPGFLDRDERRDADAAADQQRRGAGGRRREAVAKRTDGRQLVACVELAKPPGTRTHILE